MGGIVAHLAHIVDRHHNAVVVDEIAERLAIDQLKQRAPFGHINVFHKVQGAHNVLQRLAGIHRAEIGIAQLVFFRCGAEAVQVVEAKGLEIVEVAHILT